MSHEEYGEHPRTGFRRTAHESRATFVLGTPAQAAAAAVVFVVSAWLTVSTVSYIGSQRLLSDRIDRINSLETAYAEIVEESRLTTEAFVDRVEALEQETARKEATLEALRRTQASLQRQLESRERQLASLRTEREDALARAEALEAAVDETSTAIARLRDERSFLSDQLETTQARLAEVSHQRDAGRRAEQGLRWQVARLQTRLEGIQSNREMAHLWFKDYVVSSVEALEHLFVGTGVDLETLIARAAGDDIGQGGPYQGIDADPGGILIDGILQPDRPITDQIRRLSALQKLASALPLTSPLDHFHVTSYYGKRKDPFTKNWAFHGGIDLGAAPGSKVLATAPGKVTFAGPSGPYGNMIEIDHGMGVSTRYGHLKSIAVQPGEEVDFRQAIAVIGSTGRSTARHLHYEVRIDDKGRDPAKFLEAGRYLVDVFNFQPGSTGLTAAAGSG